MTLPGRTAALDPTAVEQAGTTTGLRPHQVNALNGIANAFATSDRTQLRAACGTGKTRVGVAVAKATAATTGQPSIVIVAVPTLALVGQTLREYRQHLPGAALIAVCSDPDVARRASTPDSTTADDEGTQAGTDSSIDRLITDDQATLEEITALQAAGISVHLSVGAITTAITACHHQPGTTDAAVAGTGTTVIVVTHISSPVVAEALTRAATRADLLVVDEAHRTAGALGSAGRTALLSPAGRPGIPADRRLFMTATPRVHRTGRGGSQLIASMDDPECYGRTAFDLPFQEAVNEGLLAAYTVAVVAVTDDQWQSLAGLDPTHQNANAAKRTPTIAAKALNQRIRIDPATLAATAALLRAMDSHSIRTAVSFHSRVWRARLFADTFRMISAATSRPADCYTVSASSNALERETALDALKAAGPRPVLVSNARVLSEGIDVPALDAILFADPRSSIVDLTQAVGRVMRAAPGKERGIIILPVVMPSDSLAVDVETLVAAGSFAPVWTLLRALADLDVSLAAQFDDYRAAYAGAGEGSDTPFLPDRITFDLPDGIPPAFMRAFTLKAVRSVASSWADGYAAMQEFSKQHGHSRVLTGTIVNGRKLDIWVSEQRSRYKLGLIRADRVAKLEALPGWHWRVLEEMWAAGYADLVEYAAEHPGRLPAQSETWRGKRIGQWVSVQRQAYRTNRLRGESIALLESLSGWSWAPHEDAWETAFRELEAYADEHGTAQPTAVHRTATGMTLGRWVAMARFKRDTLDPVRKARLEALPGWSWDPFADLWNERYAELLEHVQLTGTTARTHDGTSGRKSLSEWVARQRTAKTAGKLTREQEQRLETLPGWTWEKNKSGHYDRAASRKARMLAAQSGNSAGGS